MCTGLWYFTICEVVKHGRGRLRAIFGKHIEKITLTPRGEHYLASGTWDFEGRGSIDGAGGQNRSLQPRIEFRIEVAA